MIESGIRERNEINSSLIQANKINNHSLTQSLILSLFSFDGNRKPQTIQHHVSRKWLKHQRKYCSSANFAYDITGRVIENVKFSTMIKFEQDSFASQVSLGPSAPQVREKNFTSWINLFWRKDGESYYPSESIGVRKFVHVPISVERYIRQFVMDREKWTILTTRK